MLLNAGGRALNQVSSINHDLTLGLRLRNRPNLSWAKAMSQGEVNMEDSANPISEDFTVLCTWCGVEIRSDRNEDSFGTCLDCFYQMVGNELNAQVPSSLNQFASDR